MTLPHTYFDVGPALTGGYAVVCINARRIRADVIVETAADVVSAAKLAGAAVLTTNPTIRALCRAVGVPLVGDALFEDSHAG